MKRAILIVALVIISLATASAQYQTTEYTAPKQIAEAIDVVDTSASTWSNVVWAIAIFYSLVVIVLTFKLYFMCDNVKELTTIVKNMQQNISKNQE
jgi:hypothetical protein